MFEIYRFWEDGRVALTVCSIISLAFLIILWNLTNGFKELNWKVWLPVIVCVPVMIIALNLAALPNGTGGVTQLFYLGFFIYALNILAFTGSAEVIILLIKHFAKR